MIETNLPAGETLIRGIPLGWFLDEAGAYIACDSYGRTLDHYEGGPLTEERVEFVRDTVCRWQEHETAWLGRPMNPWDWSTRRSARLAALEAYYQEGPPGLKWEIARAVHEIDPDDAFDPEARRWRHGNGEPSLDQLVQDAFQRCSTGAVYSAAPSMLRSLCSLVDARTQFFAHTANSLGFRREKPRMNVSDPSFQAGLVADLTSNVRAYLVGRNLDATLLAKVREQTNVGVYESGGQTVIGSWIYAADRLLWELLDVTPSAVYFDIEYGRLLSERPIELGAVCTASASEMDELQKQLERSGWVSEWPEAEQYTELSVSPWGMNACARGTKRVADALEVTLYPVLPYGMLWTPD